MSEATTTTPAAPIEAVIRRVLGVYRRWGRDISVAQMRADWDALFGNVAVDAAVEPVVIGAMGALSGEWITAPGADTRRVVLYFHGGGFQVGSVRSHRELMAGISAVGGCRVLGLEYRLAPEHRYPGALEDACTAYDWLVAQGIDPSDIVVAGDSAGGNLALAALLRLREAGRILPAGAVLMSAWTDMTASGASYVTRAQSDPIHQRPMILAMARNYLGPDGDARDPLVSPLLADLAGLPPLLIQVGERETVLDDSTSFAAKARAAGVDVELEVWDGMIHVFQQFPAELSEAREALAAIGRFLRRRWT
ncbi:alpha/beta hydrolase [Variovorax ginsengisoli]|uniref:Acetyl esterase/lipase n=1 Tax=Variovorax ginsengisoli TaxID=363844 RepID=A0ABT9SC60_9BURK|nr:alpha/beta hydrolase [Variovorax ginsengisoli]MDP9900967.1 acetyl esterase/lipase [Variovorax ginsengisoli]